MAEVVEVFSIKKVDGGIRMDAKCNAKDLTEEDIEKIDSLIELWKRLTVKEVR